MTASLAGFSRLAPTRSWLSAHPTAFDAGLAAAVLLCMVAASFADPHGPHGPTFGTRTPEVRSLLLMVTAAGALVFRRVRPVPVVAVTGALCVAELVSGDPPAPVAMSVVVGLYTVASRTDRPTTWRVGLPAMTVLTGAAVLFSSAPWYSQENLGLFAWTGMASAAGDAVRSRRAFVDAMRERAERAERTREEEARRRVAEERLRIARDLHDVVAHHIALVNVQAGVAAHVMDRRPDQAKEALSQVREASRSALNELRATVGLLRQSGDPAAPTEPAPGLAVLEPLLDGFRRSGMPVRLARTDRGAELPAAVDLAAYRIVQEALTNVRKHAGAAAKAEVSVVRVVGAVEVTVLDDGRPAGPGPEGADGMNGTNNMNGTGSADGAGGEPVAGGGSGGHGLVGMRERVTALGGTLIAGPRYGGGFRVQAILPVEADAEGNVDG
ncbi:sensor histidine kinase [Streptomyces spongiicola]|uniref:histidine kinase n=1 Tax=Streptomyces spongiicola TaxID=1690221 RepID=A0ABM6V1W8_9ACTN|nr:histidine kinase [Streptomyces spongiicola]AWK08157.1 two-component sensor histidine kinase [Streptomyces spongiicola]